MKKSRKPKGKSEIVRFFGRKIRRSEKKFLMKLARAVKADEFENKSLRSLVVEYIETLGVNKKGFIVELNCALIGVGDENIKKLILPSKLEIFNCSENELNYLPEKLPPSLKIINCAGNEIKKLPRMPKNILILICTGNPLENSEETEKLKNKGVLVL